MRRIVFTSRASQPFRRHDIARLCEQASRRNEASGLTGLFLFDGFRFLQALEGEDVPLSHTMDRISQDDRHHDMVLIVSAQIATREFNDWTMSQPLYGIGDDPARYMQRIKNDVVNVSDPHLKAQFIGFASLARNARFRYE